MEPELIGISVGLATPFVFLYTRKVTWLSETTVYILTGLLFISGLIIGLFSTSKGYNLLAWGLCSPFPIYIIDRLFKRISYNLYNRDFILWIRNSPEIDDSFRGENPHVKVWNKVFSIGMVFLIFMFMCLGVILLS